jgi:hypothetical protein
VKLISSFYCTMSKVVKCGRWKPENMETAFEAVRNGDVGLNAGSRAYPLRKAT